MAPMYIFIHDINIILHTAICGYLKLFAKMEGKPVSKTTRIPEMQTVKLTPKTIPSVTLLQPGGLGATKNCLELQFGACLESAWVVLEIWDKKSWYFMTRRPTLGCNDWWICLLMDMQSVHNNIIIMTLQRLFCYLINRYRFKYMFPSKW